MAAILIYWVIILTAITGKKMVLVFPSKYLVLVARFQSTHFASGLRVMHQSKALRNMST